jgi:hypothetical protein
LALGFSARGLFSAQGWSVIGLCLINGEQIFVSQMDGANREYDSQGNGQDRRDDEFESYHFAGHRAYSL